MARQQGYKSSGGHSPRKKHQAQLRANKESADAAKRARRSGIGLTATSVHSLIEKKKGK